LPARVFAQQIQSVLAWTASHVAMAAVVIGALVCAYVVLKAWQRWRITRFLASAAIGVDELRAHLDAEPKPFVIDVGSSLAHGARPHIAGAVLLDLDTLARSDGFPDDRDIVLYCACPNEESATPRRPVADPERLSPRATARGRHRRLGRGRSSGRAVDADDVRAAQCHGRLKRLLAIPAGMPTAGSDCLQFTGAVRPHNRRIRANQPGSLVL
jgi:hypothetical protein